MEGTSRSIASGLAFGVAAAMTPFYGLHTVVALAVAWIFGANMVGAAVVREQSVDRAAHFVRDLLHGDWILGGEASSNPDFINMFRHLTEAVMTRDMELFAESIWPVLQPMAVGSVPLALAVGFTTYLVLEPLIRAMRLERALRFRASPHHPKGPDLYDAPFPQSPSPRCERRSRCDGP